MPPAKKQKTGANSSADTTPAENGNSATQHKNDEEQNNDKDGASSDSSEDATPKIDDNEYVCIPRPFSDYETENYALPEDDQLDEDAIREKYSKEFEEAKKNDVFLSKASEHPEWKFIIQYKGWKLLKDYELWDKYCDPDNFRMYIYNDFHAYGLQQIVEWALSEFNKEISKGDKKNLQHMWAIVSSLGQWLGFNDMLCAVVHTDDGPTISLVVQLIGHMILTALAAIEEAGELKPDSTFLDLTLVISTYLEAVHDMPSYGIEWENVAWAREVVSYFRKAQLDPAKGIAGTAKRVETCSGDDGDDFIADMDYFRKSAKNPWGWDSLWKAYLKRQGGKSMVGQVRKYDITKMTRAERKKHAFDGKDPLADVSEQDLKNDRIDFA